MLADMGLATPQTPKLPSKPVNKKMLDDILNNPYYKGIVTYNGAQYQGKHEAIVDEETWNKVQEVLRSHINGERKRIHDHYLKSSVFCGSCGARLIIINARNHVGDVYPYFVCSARHAKRNNCKQKALLIADVEKLIEEYWDTIAFTSEFKKLLRDYVFADIDKMAEKSTLELRRFKMQKEKLAREQHKLMEAHYADAVPLHILKEEQDRISKALGNIKAKEEAHQTEFSTITSHLDDALALLDDCGKAYRLCDGLGRRYFNQALFTKIMINDGTSGGGGTDVDAEHTEPYNEILNSHVIKLKHQYEKHIQENAREKYTENNENEQGESPARFSLWNLLDCPETHTSTKNFFSKGLSKDFLVRHSRSNPNQKIAVYRRYLSPLCHP
jgi:hypothetical protein